MPDIQNWIVKQHDFEPWWSDTRKLKAPIARVESMDVMAPVLEWKRIGRFQIEYSAAKPRETSSVDAFISRRLEYSARILREVIEIDPDRAGGVPVLAGTRFTVAQLLAEVADGHSVSKIAKEFGLDREKLVSTLHAIAIQLDRSFAP